MTTRFLKSTIIVRTRQLSKLFDIKWSHYYIREMLIHPPPLYRLILTAVLVTSKFYNDIFYGNHFVAYVGGVCL